LFLHSSTDQNYNANVINQGWDPGYALVNRFNGDNGTHKNWLMKYPYATQGPFTLASASLKLNTNYYNKIKFLDIYFGAYNNSPDQNRRIYINWENSPQSLPIPVDNYLKSVSNVSSFYTPTANGILYNYCNNNNKIAILTHSPYNKGMYSSKDVVSSYEIGYFQSVNSNTLSDPRIDNDSNSSIGGSTIPSLTTGFGWGVYVIRLRIPSSKIVENIEKGLEYITFRITDTNNGNSDIMILDSYPTLN
jgi:hypothetical protein